MTSGVDGLPYECTQHDCAWVFPDLGSLQRHLRDDHTIEMEFRSTSSTGGQKGVKLERFDLIPAGPLAELALHYGRGARKYDPHQWRKGYEWSKSISALGRHFNDFIDGKDYDVCPESNEGCSLTTIDGEPFPRGYTEHGNTCYNHTGSHMMAAVAWHALLLLEFKDTHPEHDDRYKHGVQR
jgi:hypothetical protein